MPSCYVHIPFCDSICFYCDFCKTRASEAIKEKWLETIEKEIQEANMERLDTLYFGGGTPSSLSIHQFQRLASYFSFYDNYEWTIEINPESCTKDKIAVYKQAGVNRASVGIQSFNDSLLKNIGRSHTANQAISAIQILKENGIENISIDLIYGLPKQTLEYIKKDIEMFLFVELNHISIYSLQIEENSIFGKQGLEPIDPQLEEEMYDYICKRLKEAGYQHYEISSFCKPNKYSRHNMVYWSDQDFYGIGCGASGRKKGIRYDNTSNISSYIEKGSQSQYIEETLEEQAFNALMMGLRTQFGVHIETWNQRYNQDLLQKVQPLFQKYPGFIVEQGYLVCKEDTRSILHSVLLDIMELE